MFRIALAAVLSGLIGAAALSAPPKAGSAPDMLESPEEAFASAMRQSIGAPGRADLGVQATERLDGDLVMVPKAVASRLLAASNLPVPPDFIGLLLGPSGMERPGIIRFVPVGFIDSNAALAWTAEDMRSSLQATLERGNPARVKSGLQALEARRWVEAPHYDPEAHQLSWAPIILPKNAPRESDGAVTYRAIGFGREGYIALSIVGSEQQADSIETMENTFLAGLNFRPGKAYTDEVSTDPRAPGGLAGAMGIDALRKADEHVSFWGSDTLVPVVGGIVAAIGGLALLLYIQRHLRRESRRL